MADSSDRPRRNTASPPISSTLDVEADREDEATPLLRRSNSGNPAEANRRRFEENRRAAMSSIVWSSLLASACGLCCVCLLFAALVVLYICGWIVWYANKDKSCDQPLSGWLLVELTVTPAAAAVVILEPLWARMVLPQTASTLSFVVWSLLGAWQGSGISFVLHAKTCQKTSPTMYRFVTFYLMARFMCLLLLFLLVFCLLALLLWVAHNGLLPTEPGPHMAAMPGLIHKLETVPWSLDMFSDSGSEDQQPLECCICQERLSDSELIKRTPCKHIFHERCLGEWLEKFGRTCPLCREDLQDQVLKSESAHS